jgi:hypothetical protein
MITNSAKKLPILTASASIDIVPLSLYKQGANDLAKLTVNIQLQKELETESKFIIPNEDFLSQKIYLPDGTKADIGDFDPVAIEDVEQLVPQINSAISNFISKPQSDLMKQVVTLMSEYTELKNASKVVTIPAGLKYITFSYVKNIVHNPETQENMLETIIPLPSFTFENQAGSKASIVILMPFELTTDVNKVLEAKWMPPSGTETNLDKSTVAGRTALTGYWQYDPKIFVKYKYN